jgi:hydrophobe/amphiphile efflux-3 (HAE3) family protein
LKVNSTSRGEQLGRWIEDNPIIILMIAALLTVTSIHFAQSITMKTGTETFVDENSRLYMEFGHLYNDRFGIQSIVVLVEGDSVISPASMKAMDRLTRQMEDVDDVLKTASIADMVMDVEALETGVRKVPDSQARIDEILEELERTSPAPLAAILPDGGRHTMIPIDLPTYLSQESLETVLAEARSAVEMAEFPAGADTIVTGEVALDYEIQREIRNTMRTLLAISGLLMVVALLLVFRHVHIPLLPLAIVLVGIIWTFGMMGLLKVPLTMVSMAAFPILIGLGIDYAIQFQNRIEEEFQCGGSIVTAVIDAVAHTAPAILIALTITGAGFVSLFSSTVPMIKDFGVLCLIGIIMCYISALFVGVTVLYQMEQGRSDRNRQNGNERTGKKSPIGSFVVKLTAFVLQWWKVILVASILLSVVGLYTDTKVPIETDTNEFIPQDLPPLIHFRHLENIFGGSDMFNFIVQGEVTDPETLMWMDESGEYITESRDQVYGVTSLATIVKGYNGGVIPEDESEVEAILDRMPKEVKYQYINGHDTAQIILDMGQAFNSLDQLGIERLGNEIEKDMIWVDPPPGISVIQTGDTTVMNSVIDALTTGRIRMTFISLFLIFFILLAIYRDLVKAVLPVLPMFIVIGWMGSVMYVSGMKYNPLTATLGSLILGVGSEYAILTMERFYEEIDKTEEVVEALFKAMKSIGAAILASALTTVFGFSALITASFPMPRSFGILTVLSVVFALLATFTVFPVLLIRLEYWRGHKAEVRAKAASLFIISLRRLKN